MKSKFYIQTMGCQMNKNDSERIAGLLYSVGMDETKAASQADVLIINTCSVRQSAEDRVFGIVKNWQQLKAKNLKAIIVLTGCMSGRDIDGKLRKKMKNIDLFFPIDQLPRLPAWLSQLNPDLSIGNSAFIGEDYLSIQPERQNSKHAYISIQTGCNNFCSYCVVPYARKRERNRKVEDILSEVSQFVANGGFQITLLGQVVNHYIAPDPNNFSKQNPFLNTDDFAALLWEINHIDGLVRYYYTAPDPQYFSDQQIEVLSLPKQGNYLHLPVQSGDNEILRKMNRKYSREKYLDLIKKIRIVRPDIAIGTDLIIGFCGETKAQFKNTLEFFKKCNFDIGYNAMYSQRPGTAAAKTLIDDVTRAEKKQRWDKLQALMEDQSYKINQKFVGQEVEVLVDSCDNGVCSGLSSEMKLVQFLGKADYLNKIIKVKIFDAKEWLLKGELA